jgi:hypothetical protein
LSPWQIDVWIATDGETTTNDMERAVMKYRMLILMVVATLIATTLWTSTVYAQQPLPYGPDTCDDGYVWREAFADDHVCVTPEMRQQAAADNAAAAARREPGGGPYGPDTCRKGYVWREARNGDHVCVTPETRAETASDNRQAGNRMAARDHDLAQEERVFIKPIYDHHRLDWCFNWGAECGQPAAEVFCKRRLYATAVDMLIDAGIGTSQPTKTLGSRQRCDRSFCSGFKFITCRNQIADERIFVNPAWKGYRLDACLTWAKDCGQPAADAFCRTEGYARSFFSVLDPQSGYAHTRLIGTDQVCRENFCTGFQVIICE